jgi:hypothetical protein
MSSLERPSTVSATISELADLLESGRAADLPAVELQRLLTCAVKLYVAKREDGDEFSPVSSPGGEKELGVTATEGLVTASEILRAIDVEVFELGVWRSWGRI